MQFTDAVTVAGSPPVTRMHFDACKRALGAFMIKQGMPVPAKVDWSVYGDAVHFVGNHDGRKFGIGAPKA